MIDKTAVIDADAHVVETERVWDYLEGDEKKFRPTLMPSPENPKRQIWVLDGENLGELSDLAQQGIFGYRPGPYSNREELLLALDRFVLERLARRP